MHSRFLNRKSRRSIISLLLMALLVRGLIPVGFMPSAERPFTLEICPDGFPAQLLHRDGGISAPFGAAHEHHHHSSGADSGSTAGHDAPASDGVQVAHNALGHASHEHDHSEHSHSSRAEHCVFAAAASAGPAPHAALVLTQTAALAATPALFLSPVRETLRFRIQQPRGPPALS